jgi:hypothetical protein
MPTWVEIVKRGLPEPHVEEDGGVSKEQEYEDRFGHLEHEFTTGWEDTYDSLTPEVIDEYWKDMFSYMNSFNFEDGENCGSIPKSYVKNGIKYSLLEYSIHAFTCDDPKCRAIFHYIDDRDYGATSALVYTRLPIYTCRDEANCDINVPELCGLCLSKC